MPALDSSEGLRIVLLGKTGSGKSATGNTILGGDVFREDSSTKSVTTDCEKCSGRVDGTSVQVIDTPGLFDTRIPEEELKKKTEECVRLSIPGPHAFLLVIRLGVRFTEEDTNAAKWIQGNFGHDAEMYTIILFTCKDQGNAEKALRECTELRRIANRLGNRTHTFNNKDREDREQVTGLITKIKKMVQDNNGKHYTNEMYEDALKKLREEEEKRKQEELLAAEKKKEKTGKIIVILTSVAALVLVLVGVIIAVAAGADSIVGQAVAALLLVLGLLFGIIAIFIGIKMWRHRRSNNQPAQLRLHLLQV